MNTNEKIIVDDYDAENAEMLNSFLAEEIDIDGLF